MLVKQQLGSVSHLAGRQSAAGMQPVIQEERPRNIDVELVSCVCLVKSTALVLHQEQSAVVLAGALFSSSNDRSTLESVLTYQNTFPLHPAETFE